MRTAILFAFLAATPSSAALITYTFTGAVDTVRSVPGVSVGDPVLATLVFDNMAPLNDVPELGPSEYKGGGGSLKVQIGSSTWSAPIRRLTLLRFDVCTGGGFSGGPCEGARIVSTSDVSESGPAGFGATGIFFGGSAEGNTVLTGPEPFPLPADLAPLLKKALEGQVSAGGSFIYYKLDPPAEIPEPATWLAGCAALLALAAKRRK